MLEVRVGFLIGSGSGSGSGSNSDTIVVVGFFGSVFV